MANKTKTATARLTKLEKSVRELRQDVAKIEKLLSSWCRTLARVK